jgi:hypothetical protein
VVKGRVEAGNLGDAGKPVADRLYQLKLLRQVLGIEWAEPAQRLDHCSGNPFGITVGRAAMHDPVAHRGQCPVRHTLLNILHQGLTRSHVICLSHDP